MIDPTRLPDDLPVPEDDRAVSRALDLPTFAVEGLTLIKRLTLIVRDGVIDDVVYPVLPPDQGAELALGKL